MICVEKSKFFHVVHLCKQRQSKENIIYHWQEICNVNLIYPRQIDFHQELVIELTYQREPEKEDSLACGIYYNCSRTKIHHPYYGYPTTVSRPPSTSSTTEVRTTTSTTQKTTSFLTSTGPQTSSESRKLPDFFMF